MIRGGLISSLTKKWAENKECHRAKRSSFCDVISMGSRPSTRNQIFIISQRFSRLFLLMQPSSSQSLSWGFAYFYFQVVHGFLKGLHLENRVFLGFY